MAAWRLTINLAVPHGGTGVNCIASCRPMPGQRRSRSQGLLFHPILQVQTWKPTTQQAEWALLAVLHLLGTQALSEISQQQPLTA